MNKFHCEMFGHFTYDENLTYHDLLDVEAQLIGLVQTLLEEQNAVHIDFTPLGDALMVQCAFEAHEPDIFHALCEGLQPQMHPALEGRLLFVDKHLACLHVFHINHTAWLESMVKLPSVQEAMRVAHPDAPGKRHARKRAKSAG